MSHPKSQLTFGFSPGLWVVLNLRDSGQAWSCSGEGGKEPVPEGIQGSLSLAGHPWSRDWGNFKEERELGAVG